MSEPRRPVEAPPPRVAALSRLPVFLDLAGRHVVVSGGGDAAAWKAEILAACGAAVSVYAPDPGPGMAGLSGIALERRALRAGDFANAAILVAETDDDA